MKQLTLLIGAGFGPGRLRFGGEGPTPAINFGRARPWAPEATTRSDDLGRFLLDDGAPAPARMVGHLDGKKYIRVEAKMALAESARASGAKAKAEKAARPVEEEDEADEGRVVGALGGCVAPMPKGSYLLAPKTPRSRRPPRQDRQGTEEVPIQTSS